MFGVATLGVLLIGLLYLGLVGAGLLVVVVAAHFTTAYLDPYLAEVRSLGWKHYRRRHPARATAEGDPQH